MCQMQRRAGDGVTAAVSGALASSQRINEKRENGPGSLEPYSQNKRDALNFLTPKCK